MSGPQLLAAHLDHSRTFDDFFYVYPVISRRSQGVSIGINLNPDKVCNFDCIYCEVDRSQPGRRRDVDLVILRDELREMLRVFRDGTLFDREPFASAPESWRRLNDIAFSGDGEPTTCPVFAEAVDVAWQVRSKLALDSAKLVLISDAACLERPGVKRGLRQMQEGAHEIWAKLDAGTEAYYQVVNRTRIPYERILRNITETSLWCPLIVQSLFLRVFGAPPTEAEIDAYAQRLNDITAAGGQLLGLQLYTVARPTPAAWATALSAAELDRIAAQVKALTGLPQQLSYGNGAE